MGLPYYFTYIVKLYTNIIQKQVSNIKYDNLYFDSNSIVYNVYNTYYAKNNDMNHINDNKIISDTISKLKEYIQTIQPTQKVFITFDGVAPDAKLKQQKDRRFKSLYYNSLVKNIQKDLKPDVWNTVSITPGTTFMKLLNEKLNDPNTFKEFEQQIIISGSNIAGEGEHKIFEFIRENEEYHKRTKTLIYGLDADLIMLSINHLNISPNIYLYRETPEFIQSINDQLEPNEMYILDIPELAKAITTEMNGMIDVELPKKLHANYVYDYIFMCFFLGNDFMPHFPAINIRTGGLDKLMTAYKETIGDKGLTLTNNGKHIYWENVKKMVEYLASNEEDYFKKEHKIRDKREKMRLPENSPENKINNCLNIPSYERKVEKYINPYKENWQYRYYNSLFEMKYNEDNIKKICINYLEGLEWTMKYYTSGCPDWRWKYNYNYPPLLRDLLRFIPDDNTKEIEFICNKDKTPLCELVQLCYVLPKQCLNMLPFKLYQEIIHNHLEWYQTDCDFSWAYCKYFWECHPNLPNVDIDVLDKLVKKYL
jgi:5'-3' exonuclease